MQVSINVNGSGAGRGGGRRIEKFNGKCRHVSSSLSLFLDITISDNYIVPEVWPQG
jgi:hypothetical protein